MVELKKDSAAAPRISLHSVKCEMLRLSGVAEEKNINYIFCMKLLRFFDLLCWFGASVKCVCVCVSCAGCIFHRHNVNPNKTLLGRPHGYESTDQDCLHAPVNFMVLISFK